MTTEMYQTWFARNWYKLDRVVDSTGTKLALGDILTDETMSEALGWLRGATTAPGAGLDVKANNRHYGARGIQHRGRWSFGGSQQHRLTYGVRAHEDFMDRYQWRDRYAMIDGQMALTAAGDSGSAGNRIESARALAGHIRAAFHVGNWTFTPGVRHERMALSRQDFREDLARLGSGEQRTNGLSVWLPGLGAHVDLVPNRWTAFAGVHRGFVPPGSSPDTEPEFSNHLEVGTRLSSRMVSGQLTVFHSEHQNLLGSDLTASGGTGSGDLFNGGASRARGIEVEAVGDVLEMTGASAFFADDKHHFPVRASYTYTQAVFTQAFESEFDPWGVVEEGDALPYLAPHQFSVAASWEAPRWSFDLNLRGMSAMRTSASQGALDPAQSTDAMAILDVGIRHQSHGHLEWFAGIANVSNDTYLVARRPYGLRPGMPRAFRAGATITF
jgi:Fe(3+) dicitrate transport protein